jgi:hypothetical protein
MWPTRSGSASLCGSHQEQQAIDFKPDVIGRAFAPA